MSGNDNRHRHVGRIRELGALKRAGVRSALRRSRLTGYMTLDYPDCTSLELPLTTVGAATLLAYDYQKAGCDPSATPAPDRAPGV